MSRRRYFKDRLRREERRSRTTMVWLECPACGRVWWGGVEDDQPDPCVRCKSSETYRSTETQPRM